MAAPTLMPQFYDVEDAPRAADYEAGQPVWVYRGGAWRPGVVLRSSTRAVMVRYRPTEGPGTGVDTVASHSLTRRIDPDPTIDGAGALSHRLME